MKAPAPLHEAHHDHYSAHLPRPTFWPAGVALGITLLFWGLIGSIPVLVSGIALFVASVIGWIKDIRNERRHVSSR